MSYIQAALAALSAAGLLTKVLVALGLAASLVVTYGVWHHKVYQSGVDDTVAKIAKADAKTIARAQKARDTYKNCNNMGRRWDQATGACL